MCGALFHRGPDEQGIYRDARVGLAHTRLSIVDLATGQQPMSTIDGAIWIAFNGEIFDWVELRKELEASGETFRTQCDTEVILAAYRVWGPDCFRRMNGQWAVAIWDTQERRLVLARDRVGVRPLHVMDHEGRLYFASEVKAIFAANPSLPRALDPAGIDDTFTFWSPIPPRTPFEGVSEIEPGTVVVYDANGRRARRYFEFDFSEKPSPIQESEERVREALERATRLRMVRADVPVGSYLSGGLDSSLVATMGLKDKGERFQTFSLRFEDAEYDETEHQRAMVAHLHSKHHEVVCTKDDIARVFPDVIFHAERPILRTAPAPLYLLSGLVREAGYKVVLTGEGADEIFGGYDLFREAKVRRFCARRPSSKMRPRLIERLYPYLARSPVRQRAMTEQFFLRGLEHANEPGFSHDLRWQTSAALKRLFSRDFAPKRDARAEFIASLPAAFSRWSPLAQDQYIEIRTLLSGYLLSSQGDRMLMAHSVEGRFPFLDRDVMELAAHLPHAHKLRVLDEKHVLKRVARPMLPASIVDRKKQPYRAPDALSFVGSNAPEWIEDMLSEAALARAGVFDPKPVRQLWEKCRRSTGQFSNADNMALVGVLSTQLLHERLVRTPPASRTISPGRVIET